MKLKTAVLTLGLVGVVALTGCKNNVVYRELGYDSYRERDYITAAEHFQAAVDKKPSDYRSQYYLGVTMLQLDKPIPAQTPLEQALALRPDDPEWTPRIADSLAEAYFQQERYETLYGFLDNMIQNYNQSSVDFLRKAKYMGLLGDADGQKTALQKAAYFAPEGDTTPYLAIADFYISVNDTPNAIQALRYGYYVDSTSDEVKDRLRGLGIVPGPTIADAPPKPELID
ncbi:tetratricopeptide (TPR) repeat protein [Algisphaera agarilytica]|uniref:Tetratricopeptide (TPR) repeat protein n=2 Tax=Algisphaera agarilytica TaxID=1385975 RepID=A0A7X0H7W2_9BACT|nr:tetratricopeptide (TPR) repeat protein [Algisphaera agarilytica]